jgi:glucose-6-phosphate 1-epimerase
VTGLGTSYLDKLNAGQLTEQQGPLTVSGALDRIYRHADTTVVVQDGEQRIHVTSGNHDSVVVWTPWLEGASAMADMSDDGYRTMLCVEAAITAEAGVVIAPDEEHSLSTVIL